MLNHEPLRLADGEYRFACLVYCAWLFLLIAGGVEQRTDLGGLGVADGL